MRLAQLCILQGLRLGLGARREPAGHRARLGRIAGASASTATISALDHGLMGVVRAQLTALPALRYAATPDPTSSVYLSPFPQAQIGAMIGFLGRELPSAAPSPNPGTSCGLY